jgi:DNA-binding MarR family transcriptional regulator
MRIEEVIKQTKPFKSPAHKTLINLMYTSAWISGLQSEAIKPYHLTIQQYNVLRILMGMQGKPATIKIIAERMIDKMSNASRLVDKLLEKNFLSRKESQSDRRKVEIFITEKGREVISLATQDLDQVILDKIGALDDEKLNLISDALDEMRC